MRESIAVEPARREWSAGLRGRLLAWFRSHPVAFVFLVALGLRIGVALFLTEVFSGRFVLDDSTYHGMAAGMASGDSAAWDEYTEWLYWSTATFMLPITALYELFGPIALIGQMFVAVVGAGVAAVTTRLAIEGLEAPWAVTAGLIVAVLPSQVFWSGMLMKDASVWFATAGLGLGLAVANRAFGRRLLLAGAAVGLLLVALAFLRPHTLVVASWAVMIAAWFGIRHARLPRMLGAAALGVFVPWLAAGIGPAGMSLVTNAGSLEDIRVANAVGANTAVVSTKEAVLGRTSPDRMGALTKTAATLEDRALDLLAKARSLEDRYGKGLSEAAAQRRVQVLERRAAALRARAEAKRSRAVVLADAPSGDQDGASPDIGYLPTGLSVMLLRPFPLPLEGSMPLRLARLESFLWYPLLLLGAIGLWPALRSLWFMGFPLLVGGGVVVMYALTEGNVGTAHRHRGEFVWVVALLAAWGLRYTVGKARGRLAA